MCILSNSMQTLSLYFWIKAVRSLFHRFHIWFQGDCWEWDPQRIVLGLKSHVLGQVL